MNSEEPELTETFAQPKEPSLAAPLKITLDFPKGSSETVTQVPGTNIQGISLAPTRSFALFAPPGYEITGELGKGGMGVVYLAKQTSLKRLVALKMIRGGGGASYEQIARFRVEAEAVARLQHPNIVQIFEVGEHDGNPFFALEYVEGGSLSAALESGSLTPDESAGMVETLARALHHAHQRDVIHRDLKPANVLLSADRAPKVTDFGLAKRLEDGDSGHTRTGAVMGTPSYMSPEQAAGKIHQIGPATDVYALGAILYECLTGLIPFKGESVLDTLEMVRSADPAPPSKIRPGIPDELETICLKAMAKEPSARYSSALAMAQDLERYRSGEPILGRREGVFQKLRRRLRRHQPIVIAVSALVVAVVAVSVALFANRSSRELRALEALVDEGLESELRHPEEGDQVEAVIGQFAELDPKRGQAALRKLHEHFAEVIREDLKQKQVLAKDVPELEARVQWLMNRDPAAAQELNQSLKVRIRTWQSIFDLEDPFDNLQVVFDPKIVRSEVDRLYSSETLTLVNLADRDTIRFEVEFQGDWPKAPGMGILLAHHLGGPRDQSNGYAFVVRPAWPKGDPESLRLTGTPPSFDATGRAALLEIRRNGVLLGLTPVQVRPGPARLMAERVGDRLMLQLNGLTSLTVEDPLPLAAADDAKVAVWWPRETSVRHIYAEGQSLPAPVSRFQQADQSFSQGKFEDALARYEAFADESNDGKELAEAHYKSGLCLARLKRPVEAIKLFESVASGESRRWGVLAAFQAWHLRLEARQRSEADAMMALIQHRYSKETITRFVPASLRSEIEPHFVNPPINWLVFDPKRVAQQETALRLAEVLQLQSRTIDREVPRLVLALMLAGENRKAREVADQYFDALMELGHMRGGAESPHWAARLHAWTGRLTGQTGLYQNHIAKHLGVPLRVGEDPENRKRAFVPLRLENARNLAFAGDWKAAEAELDTCLAEYPAPILNYSFFSEPRFMKGFARLKANDPTGAATIWKGGTYANYLESMSPESIRPSDGVPTSRKALIEAWVMSSLSETLTDDDTAKILKGLSKPIAADDDFRRIIENWNISPAIMRGAWTSPRGKEWARKMAFLDLSVDEYYWTAPRLLVYETICRDAFLGKPTPAQDEVIWQTSLGICEAIRTGELSRAEVLQLVLAWKGSTDQSGWVGLVSKWKPELRSNLAYAFGCRYRQLNKLAEATKAFQSAATDAPAGSPLRGLAEAELQKK